MGILNQQLFIGDKIIANDITTNRSARSVTKRNGFYLNHMYPDNRARWTGQSLIVGSDETKMYPTWVAAREEQRGTEQELLEAAKKIVAETIAQSETAAQLG